MDFDSIQSARVRRAEIVTLRVFHLGILIFTDAALDGKALEARTETERFEVGEATKIDEALRKIDEAGATRADVTSSARWGLVFESASERILCMYADANGTAGTIDGEPVSFASTALVDWLRSVYGPDFVLAS
jgi:hypothetical protein